MRFRFKRVSVLFTALSLCAAASAPLPPPPAQPLADWAFPWADEVPGVVSADALLDKPAGKNGPIVARDGHFFTGEKRIRFVGVNLAFSANFPPHDQADLLAKRLSAFGVNIVRFHHMDNQPFPNGIFADKSLEKLSPEALDRLDYLIAALEKEGVYANLNLHVSRPFSRTNKWENADKLEGYDKQVDLFHPDLIAANKRYAKDLLTHVNAYTKTRYTDEPAVAMVEINNEDTLFLWGGEQKLAELPEPYAGMLQKQWNQWLLKTYGRKENLQSAWNDGAEPLGAELIEDPATAPQKWIAEQHGSAKMQVSAEPKTAKPDRTEFKIEAVDGTDWHLQFNRPGIALKKGKFYTLSLEAVVCGDVRPLGVGISMSHAPWGNLGLSRTVKLMDNKEGQKDRFKFGFVASTDDDNARVQFTVGGSDIRFFLQKVSLREGGREGLASKEDPSTNSVARGGLGNAETPARTRDWYRFLQETDQAYFVGMREFLLKDLGVKAPITGTIGLGILGTLNQAKMDFVDSHAYWDHPHFPRKQWDMKDWEIKNQPMVDNPAGSALWTLSATRVFGKPFTVTEYNHAAPNDWQAECVPMVFAYAAMQDWDAVFLFDYSGDAKYQKGHTSNFFSIEGNVTKMAALPLAARLFLSGAVKPAEASLVVQPEPREMLDAASAYFYQQWAFLRDVKKVKWEDALNRRLSVWDVWKPLAPDKRPGDARIQWSANDPGTGRFTLADPSAAVFVGFAKGSMPVDLGPVRLTKLETPFAAIQVVPAEPGKMLADSSRLLISAIARTENADMKWDAKRTNVSNQWGKDPPKIEVVKAELQIPTSGKVPEVWAIGPDGKRTQQVQTQPGDQPNTVKILLGSQPTVWYEVAR